MSVKLDTLTPKQINQYDVVTDKFEHLVHKQAKTLFLKDVEQDFMQYVGKHFYTGHGYQRACVPSPHCLNKAYEMSRVVFLT